ncbi:hypothetical protein [Paenibacillus lactis]
MCASLRNRSLIPSWSSPAHSAPSITFSAFTTLFYLGQALLLGGNVLHAFIFLLISLLFNAAQIIISLYLCRKYGSTYRVADYVAMFLFSQWELVT